MLPTTMPDDFPFASWHLLLTARPGLLGSFAERRNDTRLHGNTFAQGLQDRAAVLCGGKEQPKSLRACVGGGPQSKAATDAVKAHRYLGIDNQLSSHVGLGAYRDIKRLDANVEPVGDHTDGCVQAAG